MRRSVRLQDRTHVKQRRIVEQHIWRLGRDPVAQGGQPLVTRQVEATVRRLAVAGKAVTKVGGQNTGTAGRKMLSRRHADATIGTGDKAGLAGKICRCRVETHFTAPNVRPRTSCF